MDKKSIGNFIQTKRKSLNISQQTLANKAGIGRDRVMLIERGEGNFTIDSFLSILDILNIEISLKSTENTISVEVVIKDDIYKFDFSKIEPAKEDSLLLEIIEETKKRTKKRLPT